MIAADIRFKIPRDEVYRQLRYDKKQTKLDTKTEELIDHLTDVGRSLVVPKAVYRDYNVKMVTKHAVILDGASFDLLGASTVHRLWQAKKVTLLAATIGPQLEQKVEEYSGQGGMSSAAVLDAVGSVAVESIVEFLNEQVETRAREAGMKTVRRFSPGYGDWPLKEQKGLLNLLQVSRIGISLTSSFMMQPQKSVSAVIGWVE